MDYSKTREIYLCFHDDTEYFCSRFIKKGFKHCFIIERMALGWLCFDPSRSDLSTLILPATWETDIIPEFLQRNPSYTVIHLHVSATNKSNYPRPAIMSCVGAIQYALGVYWPTVFTPWMLYNRIIKKTTHHIKVIQLCQAQAAQNDKHNMQQKKQSACAVNLQDKQKS